MQTPFRIFVYSWKYLFRNAWIGLATIVVFFLALLSVNVLLGVNVMMHQVVRILEDKVDATVSFKPDTPEQVVTQAKSYLLTLPQTKSVVFVSQEDVLKAFRERNSANQRVMAGLDELHTNPLGSQLVVKAKTPEDYPFLLQAIQGPQYAAFIQSQTYDDHKEAIHEIGEIARKVQIGGAVLVALFASFGLLIAFNAVRVAIYTHREEIAIMRLVGASSAFIRLPFVLEGFWLSLVSFGLAAVIVWLVVRWVEPILMPWFSPLGPGLSAFFFDRWPLVVGLEFGGLAVLVMFVSWIAVGRYIKR